MKKIVIVVALLAPLLSSAAFAQERAGDAALGALSGAVVLGPIGAVAGAVVGYTTGPAISRSWRQRHSVKPQRRSARRSARRLTPASDRQSGARERTASSRTPLASAPLAAPATTMMPPVQPLD